MAAGRGMRRLAKEAGVEAGDEELRRADRKRKKKASNEDWVNPHDPDAEVMKMKDGSTHLSYKAEQAVDLDSGAIVAITTHGGETGDTTVDGRNAAGGGFGDRESDRDEDGAGAVQSA